MSNKLLLVKNIQIVHLQNKKEREILCQDAIKILDCHNETELKNTSDKLAQNILAYFCKEEKNLEDLVFTATR